VTVILGPAPCQSCGSLVVWARLDGLVNWRDQDGARHACRPRCMSLREWRRWLAVDKSMTPSRACGVCPADYRAANCGRSAPSNGRPRAHPGTTAQERRRRQWRESSERRRERKRQEAAA